MFERFTERARRVMFYARVEAGRFGSSHIETEHLLLGLIREDSALVNRFLISAVSEDSIRRQIVAIKPMRESIPTTVDIPLTDESDSALSYATEEADRLGHQHLSMEHILLGLLRKQDCFAAQMLRERGAELEVMRKKLATAPPPVSPEARSSRSFEELSRSVYEEERRILERGAELEGHASGMYERYTEKARRSIFFARYEASQFGSPIVETEHLLLGALREDKAHFDLFMPSADSIEAVRKQIEEGQTVPAEKVSIIADLPLSEECKQVQAYADEEATLLGSKRVGPEHLMLGLLREEGSFAARILRGHGAELERIRRGLAG
ncbi:MAG: Clp protease N-terminal domain-containing protein [Candidatus Sulfotelmatobacter sp.]